MGKILLEVISQGAQVSQIGAEDDGTIIPVVAGDAVVEVEVDLGVEEGVLAEEGRNSNGFDPLACYRCGVRGHLARDCPSTGGPSTSGGSSGPTRGSSLRSGQFRPKKRTRKRTACSFRWHECSV